MSKKQGDKNKKVMKRFGRAFKDMKEIRLQLEGKSTWQPAN
uniref:Uncharacterized protein n=1 Tax=viral metagenome TaxID=1070528 RepID=A0A6M3LJ99_9ZZZZ